MQAEIIIFCIVQFDDTLVPLIQPVSSGPAQ